MTKTRELVIVNLRCYRLSPRTQIEKSLSATVCLLLKMPRVGVTNDEIRLYKMETPVDNAFCMTRKIKEIKSRMCTKRGFNLILYL